MSEKLNVSEMTIRRDLRFLKDKSLITLIKGGAIIKSTTEFSFKEREKINKSKKNEIVQEAVKFINSGDTIILDGSSTSYLLSKLLPNGVIVVTNNIPIALHLMHNENIEVILLGGKMRHSSGTLVGPKTETMLHEIHVDKAFLSSNAIDMEYGLSDKTIQETAVKKEMINSARENYILIDSSKINRRSFCKVCEIEKIDNLIVDSHSEKVDYKNLKKRCDKNDINLIIT